MNREGGEPVVDERPVESAPAAGAVGVRTVEQWVRGGVS